MLVKIIAMLILRLNSGVDILKKKYAVATNLFNILRRMMSDLPFHELHFLIGPVTRYIDRWTVYDLKVSIG